MVQLGVGPFAVFTKSLVLRHFEVMMKFWFGGGSSTQDEHGLALSRDRKLNNRILSGTESECDHITDSRRRCRIERLRSIILPRWSPFSERFARMDFSDVCQIAIFIAEVLYLGYWLLGWLVWKRWLRFENEGWFGRLANGAGRSFERSWQDARWGLLAMLIILGCVVVGLAAYGIASGVKKVLIALGVS